jgi:putative Holliday junction resolvase
MTVIGLDLGRARVGVAVSDELGSMAHPRPNLDGRDRKALLAALARLAREEGAQRFVLGLPLEMTGERGPAAARAVEFATALANATGLEVELIDERLSTVEAGRALAASQVRRRERRQHIDAASAVVILQAWLDRQG